MNPLFAFATLGNSIRQHPWLMIVVILGMLSYAGSMQWPAYSHSLGYLSKGLIGLAIVYSGGAMISPAPKQQPSQTSEPTLNPPTSKP
jgi:hypothetical protein